ncbi:formimidoylglutamase [Spongiimicrobium salis]|uniref:formimidoylglutamase n=1 Tax=Spongiimicrobium salis TaxID=1667022 RepID=UPI00374CF0F6
MEKSLHPYQAPDTTLWTGRSSGRELYLHEKIQGVDLSTSLESTSFERSFGILGYACDEGVRRNLGRTGATQGPDEIRKQLGKLPNHLPLAIRVFDAGNVHCMAQDLEQAQQLLAEKVSFLLQQGTFPILLGGGHDMAYGHYCGIQKHLQKGIQPKRLGIINFDAHFDLRPLLDSCNSGTPFYQISEDCKQQGLPFQYCCLGIREDANDADLFLTARQLGVHYILNEDFTPRHFEHLQEKLSFFMQQVDHLYVTVDLDGFSSAYAPGSSAASPMGFSPTTVLEVLKWIMDSQKLISLDIAEYNPIYDRDHQTAKLAAALIHKVLHEQTRVSP